MPSKSNKKVLFALIISTICILLFIDRCTTHNLTTSDIFKPKTYKNFKSLVNKPKSENYEIVPANGHFPALYDSIKNEFYIANYNGLTKYDALGNIIISADLANEKYTSIFDFANFIPYVFAENGVYDFSGNKLTYNKFSQILNTQNEINDQDFKTIFEKYYKEAELVVYETDRNIDYERECFPMYFKINNNWILLFSQKGETRFTHLGNSKIENDTIGQMDFENFPAKFADKRLIVLKDNTNGIYSGNEPSRIKITDTYLKMYYTQILKEQTLDYQTTNTIKLLARKKEEYYFTGSVLDLPDWVAPSFINAAYFQLSYNNENLFFKEKAVKYYSDIKCKNDLYLYELPKRLKTKSKVAFLHYALDIGGYRNDSTNIVEPIIKNAGLYIIKPKNFR